MADIIIKENAVILYKNEDDKKSYFLVISSSQI